MKKINKKGIVAGIVAFFLLCGIFIWRQSATRGIYLSPYPEAQNFVFTITDDPDSTLVARVKPIYDLLYELGFRTTVAVWVKEAEHVAGMFQDGLFLYKGQTCESPEYLKFVQDLQSKGFEIALHGVSGGHDFRQEIIKGYENFKEFFGDYPKIEIMHSKNRENIYWGKKVFTNPFLQKLVSFYDKREFFGEDPKSPYFWGDVCKEKTKYVRMWGTPDTNTLKFNPSMPYHDPNKPYVNYWFSFSNAQTGKVFKELLSDRNIHKLVKERGACIVYTHLGSNFCRKDDSGNYYVKKDIKNQLIKLSQQKDGWFPTVSDFLDRLLLLKKVYLSKIDNALVVENKNKEEIEGLTIIADPGQVFYNSAGDKILANEEGEIIIGDLAGGESMVLCSAQRKLVIKDTTPSKFEGAGLVWGRIRVLISTRLLALKERLF
ncbi:MAG: hypothetical protein GY853_08570 [PVC group bacterium]|nr:hypothetical protein [PVC group bacterium]